MWSTEEKRLTIGNEFAFSIERTPQLARYKPYFETDSLAKDKNIYLPPYSIYGSLGNTISGRMTDIEVLNVWKSMPDIYLLLPEILHDHKKNPLIYNIKTKKIGCYYSVTRMWDGSIQNSQAIFFENLLKEQEWQALENVLSI